MPRTIDERVLEFTKRCIAGLNMQAEAARQTAVKLAADANLCRICLAPAKVPIRLAYGKEYACEACLKGREKI